MFWPALHLISVARFPNWWEGWVYGARYMTDALPGLFLLSVDAWPCTINSVRNKIFTFLLILTGVFSIYVNSYQGLYNQYAFSWNAQPNIDFYPDEIFDWRFPQFMSSKESQKVRAMIIK